MAAPAPQAPVFAPVTNTSSPADPASAKIDALTAAIASLGDLVKMALQVQVTQQAGAKPRSVGATTAGVGGVTSNVCNFCGSSGHFIRECEVVAEFIKAGKCKRSTDGK